MRLAFRIIGILVAVALLLVVAAFFIPAEKVAGIAAAKFREMTGRELTIAGSVRPTIWPVLGVSAQDVTLANADWSKEGPMLTARSLEISLDLMALVGGEVRVSGLDLIGPRLVLERAADGRGNWDFGATKGAASETSPSQGTATPATPGSGPGFTLDRAEISDGTVIWIDHASGDRREVTGLSTELAIPDFAGPVEIEASGTVNGAEVDLSVALGSLSSFLDGKLVDGSLNAESGKNSVAFKGRMSTTPAAEGDLSLMLGEPGAGFGLIGFGDPGLPAGLGRDGLTLNGQATLTEEGTLHLRDGSLTLDGNRLNGGVDVLPGKDRPKIVAKLSAGALDLSALGAAPAKSGGGGGGGGAVAPPGWSTAQIDVSALGLADAELALAADSIDFGSVKLGRTRLGSVIDAGRAVVDVKEMALYGGSLAGQAIVNSRGGLSTRADLTLSGLALQPLLSDMADFDRLVGTGDIRFNLLASGNSQAALMRSLSGDGSLAFGKGEVLGLDLAGMLLNLDPNYVGAGQKTVYDRITGTFTVNGGILSNADLAVQAPLVTASGSGTVDIGGQSLNYRLVPTSLGGKALGADAQVPVTISGPWSSPRFGLDLESIARAKLEAKAQEELQKQAEKLGIAPVEGESLEDTARRAGEEFLKQEAQKQLEKLLGGGN